MKRILITGANSYIGTSFERYIKNFPDYEIKTIDMQNPSWKNYDFSGFNAVFHVAGLAHADPKPEMRDIYYKVNTDLAVETAEHAKACGVHQFIFMSSIIVYGSKNTHISSETLPQPDNFYGDSKLQADLRLEKLKSDTFKVASIRPPMIYGPGSKGNYPRLSKLSKKTPVFPDVQNERSMLYIENLCECIRLVADSGLGGYFYPQNREYVNVSNLVQTIHPKVRLTRVFNPIIRVLKNKTVVKKVFGDMVYDKSMSGCFDFAYCVKDFETSIRETEGIK